YRGLGADPDSHQARRHEMNRIRQTSWALGAGLLGLVQLPAMGAEIDFYRDLYPVLKANCISCHNKTTTKAGLNMESPELMRKGGETGPGVIPGKSAESRVVQGAADSDADLLMPPRNDKLSRGVLPAAE